MGNTENKTALNNTRVKDNGAKLIFDDPVLCSQFLRGYVGIDILKEVRPDDIEDISDRFLPMWQEGRDSDSVKRVSLKEGELFLIAIIEHQSKIHYDLSFRILRYIVMVLTDYAAEQEKKHKGITRTKDFRYPPILPVVFYDGPGNWTAAQNFRDRVYLNSVLGEYIPGFQYIVVPLGAYTDRELIEKEDELSLIMLVDKLRNTEDFKRLQDIPQDYLENMSRNSPEYLLKLIGKIISVLLFRLNVPRSEVEAFTDQIERRELTMLFENFEAYDVQETRRQSKAEGRAEGRAEDILLFLEEKGTVSDELRRRILAERDETILIKWLKTAAAVKNLEDFTAQM